MSQIDRAVELEAACTQVSLSDYLRTAAKAAK